MLPIILGAALVGAIVGAFASSGGDDKILKELKKQERKNDAQMQQMHIKQAQHEEQMQQIQAQQTQQQEQVQPMQKYKRMLYGSVSLSILSAPIEGIASAIGQKMGFEMWDAFGLSQFFQNMLSAVL